MKYKVGDKVRIRKDLKEDWCVQSGRYYYVVEGMLKYKGKTATIIDAVEDDAEGYYLIDIGNPEKRWTDRMFESIEDNPINSGFIEGNYTRPVYSVEGIRLMGNEELLRKIMNGELKDGDTVRVIENGTVLTEVLLREPFHTCVIVKFMFDKNIRFEKVEKYGLDVENKFCPMCGKELGDD